MNTCFDAGTGQALIELVGCESWVGSAAFSPDGATIATGGSFGEVHLSDAGSGQCLWSAPCHQGQVWQVTFSPDGAHLATASQDQTIQILDAATGSIVRTLAGHSATVTSVDFDPTGKRLASASLAGDIAIWDVHGRRLRVLHGHAGPAMVRFSPDGTRLVSAGGDKVLKLWNARPQAPSEQPRSNELLWKRVLSPDRRHGYRIRVEGATASGEFFNPSTGAVIAAHPITTETYPQAVVFSPNSGLLALAKRDASVVLYDAATGKLARSLLDHADWVLSCAFSPDGQTLVSGSRDGSVRLWDVKSGVELHTLGTFDHEIQAAAFSRSGRQLAVGGEGIVLLFDVETGLELPALRAPDGVYLIDLCFVANDRRLLGLSLAAGGGVARVFDPRMATVVTVTLWDPATGQVLQQHHSQSQAARAGLSPHIVPDPTGQRFVVLPMSARSLHVYDSVTGREMLTLESGRAPDAHLGAFAGPRGRRLEVVNMTGKVASWDAAEGWDFAAELEVKQEAEALVEERLQDLVVVEPLIAELRNASDLSVPLREAALRCALSRRETIVGVQADVRAMVSSSERTMEEYREALRKARVICRHQGEYHVYQTTLGRALYRVGEYEEALAALSRGEELSPRPDVFNAACTALANHHLGRDEQAQAALDRFREIMQKPPHTHHAQLQDLLREAESLIDPGSQGASP